MNKHSSIKWAYIMINDEDFYPQKTNITLNDDVSKAAYKELKQNYSALCDALFRKVSEDTLELKISFSGYLGTDSRNDEELLLRQFFDNNEAPLTPYQEKNNVKKYKPIYLSRDSFDKNVYELFSQIIKDCGEYGGEDFGCMELGFDDSRGYTATDGEEEWESSISIDQNGGQWL